MSQFSVKTEQLFSGADGAIAQNNFIDSQAIDVRECVNGFFSLHMIHVGGTVTATLLVCSTKDGTYVAPTTAVNIFNTKAAGTYADDFEPPLFPFFKIRFTETNVAAVTSLKAWINYQ